MKKLLVIPLLMSHVAYANDITKKNISFSEINSYIASQMPIRKKLIIKLNQIILSSYHNEIMISSNGLIGLFDPDKIKITAYGNLKINNGDITLTNLHDITTQKENKPLKHADPNKEKTQILKNMAENIVLYHVDNKYKTISINNDYIIIQE